MNKKIPLGKKLLQWGFTIIMGSILYASIEIAFEEAADDYRGDQSLAYELNAGLYGDCVNYYDVLRNVDSVEDEVYRQYEEFVNFYENYMLYVQYEAYDEQFGTNEYEEKSDKCMQVMQDIAGNTVFFENEPHYGYLLSTLE